MTPIYCVDDFTCLKRDLAVSIVPWPTSPPGYSYLCRLSNYTTETRKGLPKTPHICPPQAFEIHSVMPSKVPIKAPCISVNLFQSHPTGANIPKKTLHWPVWGLDQETAASSE